MYSVPSIDYPVFPGVHGRHVLVVLPLYMDSEALLAPLRMESSCAQYSVKPSKYRRSLRRIRIRDSAGHLQEKVIRPNY